MRSIPRPTPALRALLLASVAAAPAIDAAAAIAVPGPGEGSARRADGLGPAIGAGTLGSAPDGWLAGRQYALNLTRDVANDASGAPAEPVTREYVRYADNLPAISADDLSAPRPSLRSNPLPAAGPSILTPNASYMTPEPAAPVRVAQLDSPAASQSNPFRTSSAPTLDEPSAGATLRAPGATTSLGARDPLTADIDRDIRQVSETLAPRVEASVSVRGRSGELGLGNLFDIETPVEASFSPNGYGRLKVVVTPTVLASGHVNQANARLLGTNPLLGAAAGTFVSAGRQSTAAGAALDVGYAYDIVSADIGSTPIGFRETNVVGGIEVAPKLTNNLTLRVLGERRGVNDSLLSFGGLRDPRTGQTWGGVTRNRGHIQLEGAVGTIGYYVGVGGGGLYGTHVKSNTEMDAGAGFTLPVYTTPTKEIRTGLNLVYFGYDRNLGNFTFGSGGYFSPQQFFAALIPVTFRHQLTPDLVYTLGASIGVQSFRAKGSDVFPNNPGLQSQLVSLAATNAAAGGTVVNTRLAGFHDIGPGGGARAEIDYRVTDNLHVGAKAGFDRSGNFTEGTGLVYARYVFNDPL